MFKLSEIRELIRLLDETSVSELLVENDGTKLHIKKPDVQAAASVQPVSVVQASPAIAAPSVQATSEAPASAKAAAEAPPAAVAAAANVAQKEDADLHRIVSPMVGTFYAAPAPDKPPYVSVGSKVTEKSVVCILEAMKLMNEIEADVRGEIVEILVENGQMVDYGQPMFLVRVER
ncbi:acetyl-CoA carboxylase biotin carboxyl carrier protein [Fodinisporobacter ferrooxydans]|uniref:Biotin carboxyl carrier protein of acetyl-CoA carboxylase n=1 Tax=Fodinisporobacter ferrooxydans TaxID=2901836 RepID=A0ABY4CIC3_9BACL|nr:acetyl-CoA carboxylase biotin carboxyl carrier protein [Alicyclobacillaceae bacterium MYW30-H2]